MRQSILIRRFCQVSHSRVGIGCMLLAAMAQSIEASSDGLSAKRPMPRDLGAITNITSLAAPIPVASPEALGVLPTQAPIGPNVPPKSVASKEVIEIVPFGN